MYCVSPTESAQCGRGVVQLFMPRTYMCAKNKSQKPRGVEKKERKETPHPPSIYIAIYLSSQRVLVIIFSVVCCFKPRTEDDWSRKSERQHS